MPGKIRRGDVVIVSLDPTQESEIQKTRPCVVVQNDVGNRVLSRTIVVPATSAANVKKMFPIYILVNKGDGGFSQDSVIECDQVRVVSEIRLGAVLGHLSDTVMKAIEVALKVSLGLR